MSIEFNTFTLEEIAKKLRVSERTVRRMVERRGFIDPLYVGRQIRFVKEDFYNWVDEQKEKRKIFKYAR